MTLEDFANERETGPGAITIADVLAASTPLHWDEAVATMQELLELVTSMHRDDIPAFEDIAIDSKGTLTIGGARRGEPGPVAAGRALHALLTTADVPVALRLFVTQANAPETYDSLAAFARALAYFGKSDRRGLIRAIYVRYRPAAATSPTSAGPVTPPPPLPALPRPSKRVIRPQALRRALVPAAVIVAVASAAVVFVLYFARAGHHETAGALQTAANETPAAPSKVPRRATATTSTKPAQAPHAPSARANGLLQSAQRPGQGSTVRSAADGSATTPTVRSPRVSAQPIPDQPAERPRFESANTESVTEVLARPAPFLPVMTADGAMTEHGGVVYSRTDADVQPPVMLQPQLPPLLMIGGPSEGLINRMELVVASDGSVERVRLLSAPRRMADMMLLSGAKLWRFAPAVKDGERVRYRTVVSWAAFP